MVSFRDSSVVIIETSRTQVKAGLGLHELLKTPSVDIQARVGLRKSAGESSNANGRPSLHPQDSADNVRGSSPARASSLPHQPSPHAKVNDYLVGTQLDEALASGQDVAVSWPFADGSVRDWVQAEAIWKHVLFTQLQLRRAQNESPVMLSIAPGLSRDACERIGQIFFERFNVAGFALLERPAAQLYAANALSGVVVDIGMEFTDVAPLYEGAPVAPARASTPVGARDCQAYLAHLLRANPSVAQAARLPEDRADPAFNAAWNFLCDLARYLWEEGLVRVPSDGQTAFELAPEEDGVTDIAAVVMAGKERAVIELGNKKKANPKASAAEQARAKEIEAMDLVAVQFRGHALTIGKERHRLCEPLFDPTLLRNLPGVDPGRDVSEVLPIQDTVAMAVAGADVDQRQYIWQGLFVTGDLSNHVKGIPSALQSRISSYLIASTSSEVPNEIQPRSTKVLSVPEYFAEYREKGDGLAAFLGTSIVAKISFHDSQSKNFASKSDYNEKGPKAVIEMSPSLL
ncbi:actin-related protein [Coniophora puteana RWD-64-598 SS2]|uniref:Actin-related protein n=1 Tax=Coniophora puteana (strain RWD-64-598) TaxID=741705 RepID=A0A5M3MIV3_CONPW|nr:actin-related protein [Coniophora puteana RWD-64-598 SS2]EIW79189.1 actin-related protein [Coniophora puteana RWD-64-598 SS2]